MKPEVVSNCYSTANIIYNTAVLTLALKCVRRRVNFAR